MKALLISLPLLSLLVLSSTYAQQAKLYNPAIALNGVYIGMTFAQLDRLAARSSWSQVEGRYEADESHGRIDCNAGGECYSFHDLEVRTYYGEDTNLVLLFEFTSPERDANEINYLKEWAMAVIAKLRAKFGTPLDSFSMEEFSLTTFPKSFSSYEMRENSLAMWRVENQRIVVTAANHDGHYFCRIRFSRVER